MPEEAKLCKEKGEGVAEEVNGGLPLSRQKGAPPTVRTVLALGRGRRIDFLDASAPPRPLFQPGLSGAWRGLSHSSDSGPWDLAASWLWFRGHSEMEKEARSSREGQKHEQENSTARGFSPRPRSERPPCAVSQSLLS